MLKVSGEAEIKIGPKIFLENNICENSPTSFKASFTDPDMVTVKATRWKPESPMSEAR